MVYILCLKTRKFDDDDYADDHHEQLENTYSLKGFS